MCTNMDEQSSLWKKKTSQTRIWCQNHHNEYVWQIFHFWSFVFDVFISLHLIPFSRMHHFWTLLIRKSLLMGNVYFIGPRENDSFRFVREPDMMFSTFIRREVFMLFHYWIDSMLLTSYAVIHTSTLDLSYE